MSLTREQKERVARLVKNHLSIIDNVDAFRYRSMNEILELNAEIADFRDINRILSSELSEKTTDPMVRVNGELVGIVVHEGYINFLSKEDLILFLNDKVETISGAREYDIEAVLRMTYYFEGYQEIWVIRPDEYRIIADNYGANTSDTEWSRMGDMPDTVCDDTEIKIEVLF